jgi:hypothetical protein
MATTDPDLFTDDEPLTLARPVDAALNEQLTGKEAVEKLAVALREAAYGFDQDDEITISSADALIVQDADDYARGFELLEELSQIETKVTTHYGRFDKPLNYLIGVVRKLKSPQVAAVTPVKQSLAKRLGAWKTLQERLDRERRERDQAVADAAARAAQAAKAAVLERVAQGEPDPKLAESFAAEAEAVRNVEVHAAPVEQRSSVPVVPGGFTRTTWRCEFDDVKELMKAYIEGRCFLDEDAIKDGLQSSLDKQAASLGANMAKAFPGTHAVSISSAVRRRSR